MKRLEKIIAALACLATAAVFPVLSNCRNLASTERHHVSQSDTEKVEYAVTASTEQLAAEPDSDLVLARKFEAQRQFVWARRRYEAHITQFGSSSCVEDLLRVNMQITGSERVWREYAERGYTREQAERLANAAMHTYFLDRGYTAHDAGDHVLAVVYLRFATCEYGYPLNPKAHRLLAESCIAIGDHTAAQREFKIAADLWPGMYSVTTENSTLATAR